MSRERLPRTSGNGDRWRLWRRSNQPGVVTQGATSMVWYQNGWASIRLRTSAVGASRSARRGGMRRRTYVVACGGISPMDQPSIRSQVDRLPWYHTIDLGNGVVTPGEYDHRPAVRHVPLPDRLDGLRCLDVGTHDGFWAFEMERRGAAEVVEIGRAHV